MDYPFYIKPICDIDQSTIDLLAEVVARVEYTKDYYFADVESNLSTFKDNARTSKLYHILEAEVFDKIPLDKSKYFKFEMNKLNANSVLKEHTDIAVNEPHVQIQVTTSHKIHIPIITNDKVRYGHRRSKQLPIEWAQMPSGFAYAYNNYVPHIVENNGDSDRYQITLFYRDSDWTDKERILRHVGCRYKYEDLTGIAEPSSYELLDFQ